MGILYLFFGAFNIVFTTNHDFNRWQVGLSFTGILIGMLVGVATEKPMAVHRSVPAFSAVGLQFWLRKDIELTIGLIQLASALSASCQGPRSQGRGAWGL